MAAAVIDGRPICSKATLSQPSPDQKGLSSSKPGKMETRVRMMTMASSP